MAKPLKSLKRAIKAGVAAAREPIPEHTKYRIGEQLVRCSQCGGELFESAPPFPAMFVGLAIQCARCSHLEIFGKRVLTEVVD